MDSQLEIISKRIKQARILKMISMDKLVELTDNLVTKQAISKYEAGKMKPTNRVLSALAIALGVEEDYFTRPFSFDSNELQLSFRKKSGTSAKQEKALKVQIQDQIEQYLEIEEILGKRGECILSNVESVITSAEQMIELAQNLRIRWKLGNAAIGNVQELLESNGIKIIPTESTLNFDGVSGVINNRDFIIVLNKSKEHIERRRFTALHELGHLLFNNFFSDDLSQREKEKLCDAFANEMLLPTSVLKQTFECGERISMNELKRLQIVYGISIDAIMHKLNDIGIINERRYTSYCIQKRQNDVLRKFVEESRYVENMTNRFESMVYSAVAKNLISVSRAATLLHSSVGTIRKYVNVI